MTNERIDEIKAWIERVNDKRKLITTSRALDDALKIIPELLNELNNADPLKALSCCMEDCETLENEYKKLSRKSDERISILKDKCRHLEALLEDKERERRQADEND